VLLRFHNSKWNVKDPYKGLCKGVSFLWICLFRVGFFKKFNNIVTNDESDEQNFNTFCINLHLSFF
jgi:hypothetical protein